jgi:hypothetical protein
MSLTQNLNEFRFNLETADLLTSMGTPSNEVVSTLGTLGFNQTLASFMVGQRTLLNSVLLRLQIYNDRSVPEAQVRSGLAVLSNHGVNSLVDYLYNSAQTVPVVAQPIVQTAHVVQQPVPVVAKPAAKQTPVPAPVPEPEEEGEELEEDEEEEESQFDTFFTARVRESEDPTHVVKMSEMYSAFTSWWSEQYEDDAPSKDELKEYLSERLGRQIKTTVTNVSLA